MDLNYDKIIEESRGEAVGVGKYNEHGLNQEILRTTKQLMILNETINVLSEKLNLVLVPNLATEKQTGEEADQAYREGSEATEMIRSMGRQILAIDARLGDLIRRVDI